MQMKTILTEWKRFLKENNNSIELDGADLSYSIGDNFIYLDGISVPEESQGKGIGTKLLNKLINIAKNKGLNKIYTEQHDADGRVYHMFNRAAMNNNGSVKSFLTPNDAEDNGIEYDDIIDHPYFGKVVQIDDLVDPAEYAPLYLELEI